MIANQILLFLLYILVGGILGVVFDFFRSLRKSIKTSNLVTYIEDIAFWIIAGAILIFAIAKFSYGELRFYMFVGLLMGVIIYFWLMSKYLIKINTIIINKIKRSKLIKKKEGI